jgi:hypothetical protein
MEMWSLIHKETKELIRFNKYNTYDDQGVRYYFTTNEHTPFWFVNNELIAKEALLNHQNDDSYFETPCTKKINIIDYEIIKFNT